MDLFKRLEEYRFEGEMYRAAMYELPSQPSLSMLEKKKVKNAYNQGWALGYAIQLPLLLGGIALLDKIAPKLTSEKKAAVYIAGIGAYSLFFILTKSFAWHYSFSTIEPIVKNYIEETSLADLAKREQEKASGIESKSSKILVPTKNNKE